MDPLFPELPEDLKVLSDKEIDDLLSQHEEAARLIDADDEEFLKGLTAEEIIEQYTAGAQQIMALRERRDELKAEYDAFVAEKEKIKAQIEGREEGAEEEEEDADKPDTEPLPEGEEEESAPIVEREAERERESVREREAVAAAADGGEEKAMVRYSRRPPAPAPDRIVVNSEPEKKLSFVAAAGSAAPTGKPLETAEEMTKAWADMGMSLGKPAKRQDGREEQFRVASLDYRVNYPEDRTLKQRDWQENLVKINEAVGNPYTREGMQTLLASGGLCAPLEPIYSLPMYATDATPVEDALPFVAAERGGFNIPTPSTLADTAEAITTIEEADDALGGTFATKACLDLTCPTYTETAVTIIAACREFGNLNAMAWPEKIENELANTRAQLAKTSENYILERIKALSVNVTDGAETLSAVSYIVDAIRRSMWGIKSRLRLPRQARFQAILPQVLEDFMIVDTIQTIDGNRFRSLDSLNDYLRSIGIDATYYLDGEFAAGDDQTADASQAAGALDGFPNNLQWAIFPAGTFLGMVMPDLNLGIVRDSTLNSTNDFQVFWERFLNIARVGPAQAAHWHTTDVCPIGQFPPAGTARTCE